MKKHLTHAVSLLVSTAVLGVAGCASSGSIENPVMRRLSWFSFMSGDDLRQACSVGETHLRLVHNANYREDVRVIEVSTSDAGIWSVDEKIMQAVNWANIVIDPDNLRFPWQPEVYHAQWSSEQATALVSALKSDHAFRALEGRVPLDSQNYFWVGAGCIDGAPWFHAWAYPSAAYTGLHFPAVLEVDLPAGRAFTTAGPLGDGYPSGDSRDQDRDTYFSTYASADGVAGRGGL